jgi:hypothetical protein
MAGQLWRSPSFRCGARVRLAGQRGQGGGDFGEAGADIGRGGAGLAAAVGVSGVGTGDGVAEIPLTAGQMGVPSVTWVRRSRMMSSTVWARTSGMRSRGRP